MDELVRQVAEKVGVSEDKARVAVETVVNFLKEKLPAPLAAHWAPTSDASGRPRLRHIATRRSSCPSRFTRQRKFFPDRNIR